MEETKNIDTRAYVQTDEQPHKFGDVYEAPANLRIFRSARLSLKQINDLIADAYANMLPIEEGVRDTIIPDLGGARQRFEAAHKIQKGFWVSKTEEDYEAERKAEEENV
jgi:hypothetical protein